MTTPWGNISNLINVNYQPPNQNFNKNLVKGRILRLITVENDHYAQALEQGAGHKLFSIIVENDVTVAILIKNKCFMRQRALLIPNNTISNYKTCPAELQQYIEKAGNGKARPALSLIKYHVYYERAIKAVFDDFIVCDDDETAKKLVNDPQIRMRCVTISGNIYDPEGPMTGGEELSLQRCILSRIKDIKRIEEEIKHNNQRQSDCKQEIANQRRKQSEFFDQKQKVDILDHKLKNLRARYDSDGREML